MTTDPNRPTAADRDDRAPTEPVEVQHYGPTPAREPAPPRWAAAPGWSSSRADSPGPASPARGGAGLPLVAIVALALLAGVVSGALAAVAVVNLQGDEPGTIGAADATPDADRVSEVRIEESSAVIDAVDRVSPAVVQISTEEGGLFGGATGTGTGVIFDATGWILTNRHVVQDASRLIVELTDGRTFDGTIYGIDTLTDLAIVKVDGADLPVAPIGSSRNLEPGQLAIAIGNPLGYENTVTTGIVSGLGRQIQAADAAQSCAETLRNLVQTDAAINPGNSGGPLLNSSGEVIGINTAVSTTAQGLGFAIPIDVAKPIMAQAVEGRELARPWIGIYYVPISPSLAEAEDLPVEYGALIGTDGSDPIFPGSPAEEAGLRAGDIVVAVDGEQVSGETDLANLILPYAPGDTVTLRVLRDNSTTEVELTLGTLPANDC